MVLVGGSSRIPLIAELLGNTFRCPIAVDTHPKNDVAAGAARAGSLPQGAMTLVSRPAGRDPPDWSGRPVAAGPGRVAAGPGRGVNGSARGVNGSARVAAGAGGRPTGRR